MRTARWFLSDRLGADGLALEGLRAADVSGFLARECPRVTVAGARNLVGRLRPLLRYLHVAGLIGAPLQWVVPGVADQRDRSLPRGLKRNRRDQLPLPVDVGEALAAYLSRRPRDESRALFLKVHAPAGALSGDVVRGVVKDACVRVGVPRVGAHRLRHTAATGMLREGASLVEIAQVLRHDEIATTAIYAKSTGRGCERSRSRGRGGAS
jgi:integrase/recombinase XerD